MKELWIDTSTWKRTQLTDKLLKKNDLVIGMAQEHYDTIAEKFGFSVKLYNELVNGEKTSIIVCSPDSKDTVEKQIRDMTKYIFDTTPILYERIKELQKRK